MLRNAWVIPLIPFVSFFVILFFGKKLPRKGSEVGVGALGAAFVLSVLCAVQWVGLHETEPVKHKAPGEQHSIGGAGARGAPGGAGVVLARVGSAEEAPHDDHSEEGGGHGAEGADLKRRPVEREIKWFSIGDVDVKAGIHIDGLAVAMLLVVSLISLLVHVFSTNYMKDDVRYTYYYAGLSLFTTGMLVLVTASNTLQALFGWELMGVCSFMLIGHWWEEQKNSNAALKAFLTTRTGDIGLLVGMSILFFAADRSFHIARTNELALAGDIGHGVLLAAAAALLVAVIGKSAQFPLHTWLPDAMAGPTPVSALIHAATMVVAGVYLVARLYGVFFEGFSIAEGGVNPVALVGGVTILIAAALAFVQSDIKKVLAYSTVSQLGYMVMALGVGAWTAGVFHLFTHAFFKALLFLGAGSVSHAAHSFDMKEGMGGLRKHMPVTYATFIIGSLALAGIFPLAGFWSKDEILLGAGANGYPLFKWIGLAGAAMTAAYMTRCVFLTFFGEYRGHGHPHESPKAITVPLVVLAFLSVTAGLVNATAFDVHSFTDWVEPGYVASVVSHHGFSVVTALLGLAAALAGIAVAYAYYFLEMGPRGVVARSPAARAGYRVLLNKYYLDHLYEGVVIQGVKSPLARAAYWFNQNVLDGIVNGVAALMRRLAGFVYDVIDQRGVDGLVNGAGFVSEETGGLLRYMQTGRVQQYAAVLFGATALFGGALYLFT